MKIYSSETLSAVVLTSAFSQINAGPDVVENKDVPAVECIPIHEQLQKMGASAFSEKLDERGLDFKYGQFTIFAPSDELFESKVSELQSEGYSEGTINDILLFHVSAEGIKGNIEEHCNMALPMLNEELHVNQETSTTLCNGEKIYQVGPGNDGSGRRPKIASEGMEACDGVIFAIKNALMLPTLSNATTPVSPTPSPNVEPTPNLKPTPKPVAIVPTASPPTPVSPNQPQSSSGNKLLLTSQSLAFAVSTAILLSFC